MGRHDSEAMPQGTTDEMAAKAFSMLVRARHRRSFLEASGAIGVLSAVVAGGGWAHQVPLMVMGTFMQATQISTPMALACTGPSDSELCWSSASPLPTLPSHVPRQLVFKTPQGRIKAFSICMS